MAFARWVSERAGLRFELDREQVFHGVTAKWWLADDGRYVLVVCEGWPRDPDPERTLPSPKGLTVADVFAIAVSGELRKLTRGELPRWKRRALVEAGRIAAPAPVALALLDDPPEPAARTWEVVARLLAVRGMTGESQPVPLSTPWLSRWSGVDEPVLRAGRRWLERRGYIERVGEIDTGKPRALVLWSVRHA